jgi:MFS family permease
LPAFSAGGLKLFFSSTRAAVSLPAQATAAAIAEGSWLRTDSVIRGDTSKGNPIENQIAAKRKTGLRLLLRALGSRNYRLYFFGQAVSLIGTWMQQIAMRWLVYRLTKSALLLGVVGFASDIPVFLLVPFAGVLADKFKRHRILAITQALAALQAFILAILVITKHAAVWHIVVVGVLSGIVNAFDIPARQAFMVDLVEEKKDLGNAIALNSVIFNGALLIGPSIAGLLITFFGEGPCFVLNGVSYLAVIVALLLMKIPDRKLASANLGVGRGIVEGATYAFRSVPIRSILLLVALVSFMGASYMILMPVFAEKILHGGPRAFGYLMSATGVGALAGAVVLASRRDIVGLGKVIVIAGSAYGIGLLALSLSHVLLLSLVIALVIGFSLMMQIASSNTIVQTIVDDGKRGRVLSLFVLARRGVEAFGSLLAGAVAHAFGTPDTLRIGGIVCLLASLLFATQLSLLRKTSRSFYKNMNRVP